jgi:hypothetical protein
MRGGFSALTAPEVQRHQRFDDPQLLLAARLRDRPAARSAHRNPCELDLHRLPRLPLRVLSRYQLESLLCAICNAPVASAMLQLDLSEFRRRRF